MSKGMGFLSLLFLFTTASQAAVDTKIIKSEAASAITLAGRIGETALFSVQADDDDDLEIFATASSQIDNQNDHWILLDWDSSDYKIIKTGSLQAKANVYLSSYQISHTEILLGQGNGLLTTITFTENAGEDNHDITESQTLLSSLIHEEINDVNFDGDIKAIVNLEGTDENNYMVLCTEELIHILSSQELTSTLQNGGYCQTGNIDYDEIASNPGTYDQELVTAEGRYFNFDGTNWLTKSSLSSSEFGDRFKIANIDDDDAQEILSQQQNGQLQSFSPASTGSWVFISEFRHANNNFNVINVDSNDSMEVIFDYVDTDEDPEITKVNYVYWDAEDDSHITGFSVVSPYKSITNIKRLATILTEGVESDFFFFASNFEVTNPDNFLLKRLNESDLSTNWLGIYGNHGRSFETLTRVSDGDSLINHNIVQIEQIDLGDDIYKYAYKFFSALDLSFQSIVEPDFTDNEIVSVNSLTAFDFNGDGTDELHAGGKATYANNAGIVISSYLNGDDYYTLDTPTLASVSALYIGDVNLQFGADIIATGEDISEDGAGIGIYFRYDNNESVTRWFAPGSGDTEFKALIASNIKGDDKPEILGLHSQLASYNPNAAANESSFYNLNNLDLNNFTPISLESRDYQYALATDASGMLHLIEPKDFDILATTFACSSELNAIYSVRINNKTDVAFGVCEQNLLSWVVEYDENIENYGYSFYELDSTDLGNADTSHAQLLSQITDPDDVDNIKTHLYALFNNKLQRFELNMTLGEDTDKDSYLNYRDVFPNEITQWEDNDRDTIGDNQTGNDPDPSLNDIDNDGVKDDQDPDNDPVNDFDFSNDIDHGLPVFADTTLEAVSLESTDDTTAVSLDTPAATDAYDAFASNATPIVSASTAGIQLVGDGNGKHGTELASGKHSVTWLATDAAGNTATMNQAILIYPSIAFQSATQTVGETQTAQVMLTLSGISPIYPLEVTIQKSKGDINDDDINGKVSDDLTVTFTDGQTEANVALEFIDDNTQESTEELELTILDSFNSAQGSESWTVDEDNNTHLINVTNLNHAPAVSYSTKQAGSNTQAPTNTNGTITLSAIVNDIDDLDEHTFQWELTSLALDNKTSSAITIDASIITPGDYAISLTVVDNGLPSLSTTETFTLTIVYGDSDGDGVADDIDDFLNEVTQWVDADGDGLGDNPEGINPDPSLNDKDNDGVQDDTDSSNNDDNGSPIFNDATLELVKSESTGSKTTISIPAPQASDLFDDFYGNGTPSISASIDGQSLTVNERNQVEVNLSSGAFSIKWQARDKSGNSTNLYQDVWVFPSIAFDISQQVIGETQTAKVNLNLSGTSPVYPLDVSIGISGGSIQNSDVKENISQNLTVRFNQGATQASINLMLLNDNLKENLENLELTILDTFSSESWTINEANQTHTIEVTDFNHSPEVEYFQSQNGIETSTPTNIAGMITIEALVTDENSSDTHSYTWDLSSLNINEKIDKSIQIDPENIEPGDYEISVFITDNGLPNLTTEKNISLTIFYGDSDNDGFLDNVDAFPFDSKESVDTDGDGIGDVADERSIDDSSGSLYFYLLILLPFLYRRKVSTFQ